MYSCQDEGLAIFAGSFLFVLMRYHYTPPQFNTNMYGEIYICDHPIYNRCTLYKIGDKGLAVIQQRYDISTKSTYWTEIDTDLMDAIYTNNRFKSFFDERGGYIYEGLYPTVSVRQIMWALKMKPLKRERWETLFDRRLV